MFFNKGRKDPLVDSVKKVMAESQKRRAAEAAVNQQFGVTSRNALPHEKYASYDKALAETTAKYLKEESHKEDEKHEDEHKKLAKIDVACAKKKAKVVNEDAKRIFENFLKKKLSEAWGETAAKNAGQKDAIQPGTAVRSTINRPYRSPGQIAGRDVAAKRNAGLQTAKTVNTTADQVRQFQPSERSTRTTGLAGVGKTIAAARQAMVSAPIGPPSAIADPNSAQSSGFAAKAQAAAAAQPARPAAPAPTSGQTNSAVVRQASVAPTSAPSTASPAPSGSPEAQKIKDDAAKAKEKAIAAKSGGTETAKKTVVAKKPAAQKDQGPLSQHPDWAKKAFNPDSGG